MRAFFALVKKGLLDSRWTLALSSAALFGLSWLFVFAASRMEKAIVLAMSAGQTPGGMRMLRGLGGASMDFSSAAIEMAFWNHPFVILILAIWAIARGSASVGGELERGSMDIVLSRPISRSSYLAAQVFTAIIGLIVLVSAMVAGNLVGSRFNTLVAAPSVVTLMKPATNLAAMGLLMFAYTCLFSTLDSVRWRPNLLGSVITLAGFIINIVANIPTLEDWKWIEKFSIFKAYNPVEIVVKGETFAFNTGILTVISVACLAVSFCSPKP